MDESMKFLPSILGSTVSRALGLSTVRSRTLVLAPICLLTVACGNDDNGSLYSSGLPATMPAATLTNDQKEQFCRSLDDHVNVTIGFEEIARIVCLPAALLLGGSKADCQKRLDDCAANAPSPITVDVRSTHEQACFESLKSCEADVHTLEGCVNVNVAAVRDVLESISCARFGDTTAADRVKRVMGTASTCASSSSNCGTATTLLL
jgi:hypothetical protein